MSLKFDEQGAPFIEVGPDICLKLDLSEYDDDTECVQKAREELRETPEVVQESLTELRSLLKEHSDLNIPVDDDAFLKKFLRPTKYYPQSALNMILGWYKFKANKKFVTDDMSTNRIRVALEEKIVQLLPKRDQLGRRIIFVEMGSKWDCSKVSYPELVRAAQAMIIIALLEPRTQLHGIQFVANFDRMSLAHLVQFTPKFAKLSVDCSQKYTPMRTKEINLVHNSEVPYVDLGGGIHIELDLSEYDDDKLCVEKAREELRETPEIVEASLKQLRELLKEPRTQLHGFVFVTNFDRLSLAHMGQFGPKFAKITLDYGQKNAPIRVKAINIVNNAKLFNVMFKVFKPFLGQKWGKRIHFHSSDMGSLHKHIDASCLPTKLGGTLEWPEYDGKVLVEFVEHYQWYFDGRFE
ncbi:hypothetical protein quinque_011661 [Culex quinquefasciatus]